MENPPWSWQRLQLQHSYLADGSRRLHLAVNRPTEPARILFLHGVLRNCLSYYTILPQLVDRCSLAALDFRGHGLSGRAASYLVIDYVDDALSALLAIGQPCLVFGHSLGAMVALAVASRAPHLVSGLVLEDPPFHTMGQRLRHSPSWTYFKGVQDCLLERIRTNADEMFVAFSNIVVGTNSDGLPIRVCDTRDETSRRFSSEALLQVDPAVLQPIVDANWLEDYEVEALLPTVACPVHVLQADARFGGMLTEGDARALKLRMGGQIRLSYFDSTGHSIHWSNPGQVLQIIEPLLPARV